MSIRSKKKSLKTSMHGPHGKRHRGHGNSGGFGRAGSGKRGKQKKQSFLGEHGKEGLKKKGILLKNITIKELEGKKGTLDLKGYKLLGNGFISEKLNITVTKASASAISKIEKAGGKITVLIPSKKKTEDEEFSEK